MEWQRAMTGRGAEGATIVVITHDGALADQLPRRIRMLDGRVVSDS